MSGQPARARFTPAGVQLVHVTVREGYRPGAIEARAGVPLRLVFHRDEDTPCSERVVFYSPHVDRHLVAHGETVVDLPSQGPGEVRFTCGMGRYRGRIRFSPALGRRRPGLASRFRSAGIGMALALVIVLAALAASGLIPAAGPMPWLAAGATLLLIGWLTLVARVVGTAPGSR